MMSNCRVAAIVVAAGVGRRMGFDKVLHPIKGRPLFMYSVLSLAEHEKVDRIVVVTRGEVLREVKRLLAAENNPRIAPPVEGGKHRYESVYNGLCSLQEMSPEIVLIQDGARPFLTAKMIDESIEITGQVGASCVAIPAQDTLKESVDGEKIIRTLDRSSVWQAQTPQTFSYRLIHSAYEKLISSNEIEGITDDASVAEAVGHPVSIVCGSSINIKVTHPEDFTIAEAFLKLSQA